ncbi:MAG TPA: hypothetical protein VFJ85_14535 [Acidimicrobiales bacterium]|nr:hypothetical protein [Acidimicrobiales bacterium]
MHCTVSSFWLPRDGSPAEHYEDAYFPHRTGPRSTPRLRVAVSDGASESMLSGLWADTLVRTWCRSSRRAMTDVMAAAMSGWAATLAAYRTTREAEQRPIEWFEQPGLERGAHATLLGVELVRPHGGEGRWSAVSLGDSCLFQVRDDRLVTSFPLADPAAFCNAPKLVPSHGRHLGRVVAHVERAEGTWLDGDVLYLATDAVAAWFLGSAARDGRPWRILGRIACDDNDAFATWAAGERSRGRLRNDDLTLVRVEPDR